MEYCKYMSLQVNQNTLPRIRVSVIIFVKEKFLLVKHKKDHFEYWLLPGGGQSFGESMLDAARRELQEELNITAESFVFLCLRETFCQNKRHIVFPIFLAIRPNTESIRVGSDPRVIGYSWVQKEEIAKMTIFPNIKEDLIRFADSKTLQSYRQLDWIDI